MLKKRGVFSMTNVYERKPKTAHMFIQYNSLYPESIADSELIRELLAYHISNDCVLAMEQSLKKMTDSLYYEMALRSYEMALKGMRKGNKREDPKDEG